MNCMKCGREIEEGQVFCIDCLKDMEKYPVRPGTAVHLPKRPTYSPIRRVYTKRKTLSPEEVVKAHPSPVRRCDHRQPAGCAAGLSCRGLYSG